jgi:hypothetical protein
MAFDAIPYTCQDLWYGNVIGEFCKQVKRQGSTCPVISKADATHQAGVTLVNWIQRPGESAIMR